MNKSSNTTVKLILTFQNYGDVPKMLKPKGLRLPPSNKCNADNKSYTDRSERTSSSDQDSAKKSALKKPFCRYITEEERKNLLDVGLNIFLN